MSNNYIHITKHSDGDKMEKMFSISTSTLINPICRKRAENVDSICHYCYSEKLSKMRKNLENCLIRNTERLTSDLLTDFQAPFINQAFFRFEAFGDLQNTIQARNYFKIARLNPHCNFSLFSKNPHFIENAVKLDGKPENLKIVLSSNKVNEIEDFSQYHYFVDHVFTVFTKEYAEENGIKINCAQHCISCLKCYKNGDFYINELLRK